MKAVQKIREIIKGKLMYQMFLSFLFPLFLLLIFVSISHHVYLSYCKESAERNCTTALYTLTETWSGIFDKSYRASNLLESNSSVISFLTTSNSESISLSNYGNIAKCYNALLDLSSTQEFIDSVTIYNMDLEYVVSTSGTSKSDMFFDQVYLYEEYSHAFWRSLSLKSYESAILAPTKVNYRTAEKIVIPFVRSSVGTIASKNLFIVNFDANKIMQMLEAADLTENTIIAVTDSDYDFFLCSDTSLTVEEAKEKLLFDKYSDLTPGSYSGDISGSEYQILIQESTVLGQKFKCIAFVPFSDLYTEVESLQQINLIIIVVGMALSTLWVFLGARWFYNPVHRILEKMQNGSAETAVGKNVMTFISDSYQATKDNLNSLSNSFNQVLPLAFEHYMYRFLNSEEVFEDNKTFELLQKSGYVFPHPYFCAVVIDFHFTPYFFKTFKHEEQMLVYNGVAQCVTASFGSKTQVFTISTDINSMIVILNLADPDGKEEIVDRFQEFCNAFSFDKKYHNVTVSIGTMEESFTGLHASYQHCEEVRKSASRIDGETVKVYKEEMMDIHCDYTPEDENHLFNYLITGQQECAQKLVSELREKNGILGTVKREELRHKIYATCLILLKRKKTSEQALMGDDYITPESKKLFTQEQAEEYIDRFINQIFVHYGSPSKENKTEAIKQFVEENYSQDIYLEQISEMYHLSVSHLSRTIKKEWGVSFSDYLAQVRIREAKKLLTETRKDVQEISTLVGFNSRNTFIRTFKKLEGITPSDYRKFMQ
jgi:two-component system response regulator YesN